MSNKPVFLDADPSIMENNLNFVKEPDEEEINKIFGFSPSTLETKIIKPFPGLCIKTREIDSNQKIFINVCKTDAIPPPKNISEEEISIILESDVLDDKLRKFKIPMSIGTVRSETDHNYQPVKVCDVAINTVFFETLPQRPALKQFFYCILFEGLREKHKLFCSDDGIVLKNKKSFGNLQTHVIRKSVIEQNIKREKSAIELLQIQGEQDTTDKPKIEVLDDGIRSPLYRLYLKRDDRDVLYAEFRLPDIINAAKELTLDIGMDRILLESKIKRYFVDIFIPMYVNQNEVISTFDNLSKILTVVMPIVNIPGYD